MVSITPFEQKTYEDVGYALPNIMLRIVDGDMKSLGPGQVNFAKYNLQLLFLPQFFKEIYYLATLF